MNGYDFELHFKGTSLDYKELEKVIKEVNDALKKSGSQKSIKLTFGYKIEDRKEKLKLLMSKL